MCIDLRFAFSDNLQLLTAANQGNVNVKLSMWTETNRTGLSRRYPQTHHTMCLHLQSHLNALITVKYRIQSHPVIVLTRK